LTRESLVLYNQLATLWLEGSLVFRDGGLWRRKIYVQDKKKYAWQKYEWQKYGNGLIYIQTLCNRIQCEYFSAVTDIRELVME
jgi:hypothetical protein